VQYEVGNVALVQDLIKVLRFILVSIIQQLLSILICHMGTNNKPVAGRSSETLSHPIDINRNNPKEHL